MKKLIMTLSAIILLMATAVSVSYADETTIPADQLPDQAIQFIKNNFPGKKIIYTGIEGGIFKGDYKVVLSDESEIEFTPKGDWEKIDCNKGCVPAKVVPSKISKYIAANYKGVCVSEIEYDTKLIGSLGAVYKVKLQNGIELKFNKEGEFKKIDD